jgi:thiamine transport system permease protein
MLLSAVLMLLALLAFVAIEWPSAAERPLKKES